MKKFLFAAVILISAQVVLAQQEVSYDANGRRVAKGFLSRQQLMNDTAFSSWFIPNQQAYTPYKEALQAYKTNKDSINFLVFGGTWCDDTRFILPKFFMFTEAAGISPDRITLVGVDRNKKTIQHLSEIFNITNVPTIIVFKNGKEMGRVVEYGHSGLFDKDLGEILNHR